MTVSVSAVDQTFGSRRDIAPENQLIVGSMGSIEFDGVACGAATVTNTDTIVVTGEPYTDLFVDLAGGQFAPGASAEADGSPEIEIDVNFEAEEFSEDLVVIWGTESRDFLVAGELGIDLTGDLDGDLFVSGWARGGSTLILVGFAGGDSLSTRGGGSLGGSRRGWTILEGLKGRDRLTGGSYFEYFYGGNGNDRIAAGGDEDSAWGQRGNDVIKGQGGNDTRLQGGAGNDRVIGGLGRDVCRQGSGSGPVKCEIRFRDVFLDD